MAHHRAIRLPAREPFAGDKQATVGEPVDRPPEALRPLRDDLGVAVAADGDDLPGSPVREPQTAFVPARRLADRKAAQQRLRCTCRRFLGRHLAQLMASRCQSCCSPGYGMIAKPASWQSDPNRLTAPVTPSGRITATPFGSIASM